MFNTALPLPLADPDDAFEGTEMAKNREMEGSIEREEEEEEDGSKMPWTSTRTEAVMFLKRVKTMKRPQGA
jgi:ADP-dependent phosphofructokinase/glucokinase